MQRLRNGVSAYVEPDQGRIRTDEKSIRFANHVLEHGPDSHRGHTAAGICEVTAPRYDVKCSCGCMVRISFHRLAMEEAPI